MWIQLHDFSADEKDDVTLDQAKLDLANFDWQGELTKRDQGGDEVCDPGLGLIAPDQSILHICPQGPDECYIHYHYRIPGKFLGLIPVQKDVSHYIKTCTLDTAAELIGHHFAGNRDNILKVS